MSVNKFATIKDAKTGETLIEMIAPPNALTNNDALSEGLYVLSEIIIRGLQPDRDGGGLGGRFGYGADYENDIFMMHPFCWCESKECLWCMIWLSNNENCTEEESRDYRDSQIKTIREKYGNWAANLHCGAPHFWHKPSGLQVRWYKWIGRDMEVSNENLTLEQWAAIFDECVKSIPQEARNKAVTESEADAKREADPEYQRQQAAAQAAMFKAIEEIHNTCEREGHDDVNGHCNRCGLVIDTERWFNSVRDNKQ